MPAGAVLDTFEFEPRHADVARETFRRAGLADQVRIHVGPALERLPAIVAEGPFDLVFIDADKPNYVNYYEATLPLLADGGLIVVDNTLWSGRVVDDEDDEESTQAIRALNDHVSDDPRVENVLLTVRDGMNIVWRA
jgi:caffeoyl-CoA O-methyltransferase